jgi:Na+-driven multidrug efflux pump
VHHHYSYGLAELHRDGHISLYPQSLASAFVPKKIRQASITYVRLSSVQFFTSAVEAALSSSTRALDNPDVPLIISSSKFVINILLDLLIISRFHIGHSRPTVVSQAIIRLICDSFSALAGLIYFAYVVKYRMREGADRNQFEVSVTAFKTLLRPSIYTFGESALRNSIYLWIVQEIVQLGETYATAWTVFNTIRWVL